MDSCNADAIQHHACNLSILLKKDHDFLLQCDYDRLMDLLFVVIDRVDDFIDV